MSEEKKNSAPSSEEISLAELIETGKKYWNYLLSKWLIILIVGLTGGALGLVASLLNKPKYTAHISFALVEKSSGGGLADLASSFGFGGLSGGNNSAFSGDNLLEIIKSRYAIEKTLLTPVEYNGKQENLVEVYIDVNDLRKEWKKDKKNPELPTLGYPVGQARDSFTRTQDSVLFSISSGITLSRSLSVVRKDKKVSIVNVDFVSLSEVFSKLFVEQLMEQTYIFYKQTKTAQSKANVDMMQHTADSVKTLYEKALYKGAGISQININQALQFAAVPRIKQERDAQLYGTVYAEVLKNLETLKLDMARETPILQMIDTPIYPLKKDKLGKVKGIVVGGILGGMLIVVYLLGGVYLKELLSEKVED
ncbi:MAG: lipopolysaccharide biosynthesis protein [Paludibacter sp.]|nr:lipopolysaccharide biosynthesis protein [Paludibacter sp.]